MFITLLPVSPGWHKLFNVFYMKLFALTIFLLSCAFCSGQIAWERPFGGSNKIFLNDVIHAPGDYFYVCGRDTLNSISRGYLAKLDGLGNTVWEQHYTVQDSDYRFDHILLLDSNTIIIQSATYALINGFYPVPRILKLDTAGLITDSIWPEISSVYNSTANLGLYMGANHTFWSKMFIGTIGVSNEIHITRRSENLDSLFNHFYGAFYDQEFSFNRKGEMARDVLIEEYDSIIGVYTPDHFTLHDTAGLSVFDTAYLSLPASDKILRTDDGGFTGFYNRNDTLVIRHFDSNGIHQRTKSYLTLPAFIYQCVAAADSGYFLVTSGYSLGTNITDFRIYKMNETDDTLWTQSFHRPYVYSYVALKPTLDGGAIAIFSSDLAVDSINYLVRLGANGERFPFTLQVNPSLFCTGDTVAISTLQPGSSYLWSTGDTTPVLYVTASGSYGLSVIDSSGNPFWIHPVNIQFDSLAPVILNDVHTCSTSVHLFAPAVGAITFWSDDRYAFSIGNDKFYDTDTVPDTLQVWVMHQSPGGCRVSDTASIFFDDCTGISEITGEDDLLLIPEGQHSFLILTANQQIISRLTMFNINGKIIKDQSYNSASVHLDVTPPNAGIYIIECLVRENAVRKKIVILN
jgi:hypothetical protein